MKRSEIFRFATRQFGIAPDYPFEKYPHYAVLRHADGGKWFGLVMGVSRDKLEPGGIGNVEIIDVKCHPSKVAELKGTTGFFPAYHMNKDHWLTVLLDGSVSESKVFDLIRESYDLTV